MYIYIYVYTHVYIPIYVYTYTYTHSYTFCNQPTAKLTLYIHMYMIIYSTIKSLRNSQQSLRNVPCQMSVNYFSPSFISLRRFSFWGFLTNELTAKFSTKNSLRNVLCKMTTELTSERFFKEVVFGSCSDDT